MTSIRLTLLVSPLAVLFTKPVQDVVAQNAKMPYSGPNQLERGLR